MHQNAPWISFTIVTKPVNLTLKERDSSQKPMPCLHLKALAGTATP